VNSNASMLKYDNALMRKNIAALSHYYSLIRSFTR